jgi:hypothetical protein
VNVRNIQFSGLLGGREYPGIFTPTILTRETSSSRQVHDMLHLTRLKPDGASRPIRPHTCSTRIGGESSFLLEFPEFLKQKMLLCCNIDMLEMETSGIFIF